MNDFLGSLSKVNPRVRVILTVSPVPLVATFENRHVLVSQHLQQIGFKGCRGGNNTQTYKCYLLSILRTDYIACCPIRLFWRKIFVV